MNIKAKHGMATGVWCGVKYALHMLQQRVYNSETIVASSDWRVVVYE